jgi:hypothetical protein
LAARSCPENTAKASAHTLKVGRNIDFDMMRIGRTLR